MNTNQVTGEKKFYRHLTVYVLVNLLLIVIDIVGGGGWWFFYPLLGWGIALGYEAWKTFNGRSHPG